MQRGFPLRTARARYRVRGIVLIWRFHGLRSRPGRGEWGDWVSPAASGGGGGTEPFFGANFIWTSLHTFGGMDSVRGNLYVLPRLFLTFAMF